MGRHRIIAAGLLIAFATIPGLRAAEIVFEDITRKAGLDFVHEHGGSGDKYMVETMGSGACFLDYDNDGDPDLYLVQGAALPGFKASRPLHNVLYENQGVGKDGMVSFSPAAKAGVEDTAWGMGCTAGDIDGDGDLDLMVTNFGPDVLYRNNGDGTFADVTAAAGVGDPRWSASAAFGDADADGDLDLYVTRYVNHTVEDNRPCGDLLDGKRSYCHPNSYSPVEDSFYRNSGDGTFTEDKDAARPRAPGNGLGVVWSDLDRDGLPDIYVANDGSPNFLFKNRGGTFQEVALLGGCAVNDDGVSEAGMGVAAADFDGDGHTDLFVTHMGMETNTLYRNLGSGHFVDWSLPSGIAAISYRMVGFGTGALDYDHDGDLDLLLANGHILDDAPRYWSNVTYAQPMHLLENNGQGRFSEVGAQHGAIFSEQMVGRGLALADVDGDGDLDAAVNVSDGPARLLRAHGATGAWIQLDLREAGPNPFAIGAQVTIRAGERTQRREVRSASSYLSQNAHTLHAGLGEQREAHVEIRWPGGAVEAFGPLAARKRHRLVRGQGKS